MRIMRLEAENFKKLRAVEITPDGNVVQITGANGSGKTSLLDCIFVALAGKSAVPSQPVREGEESAVIRLDLGEMVVTRKFTRDGGTTLTVATSDGAKYGSPQTLLDKLLGTLTFDPLAFSRMASKDQRAELGRLLGITDQLNTLEKERAQVFAERTDLNRDLKTAIARRDAVVVTDEPIERVDVSVVMAEIYDAEQRNSNRDRDQLKREAYGEQLLRESMAAQRKYDDAEQAMREAKHELTVLMEKRAGLDAAPPLPDIVDVAPLRLRIHDAQAINAECDRRVQRAQWEAEVLQLQREAEQLTQAISEFETAKAALVQGAAMPIEGLGFTEDGVTYKGLPLDQASSAEQLRVSVAIAMASNPKLRVLRIADGSLLDSNSLALLEEMAIANDYQCWVEIVREDSPVGIIMEDGTAREASAAAVNVEPTPKRRRPAAGV